MEVSTYSTCREWR